MFTVSDHLAKIVSCTHVSEKHAKERMPAISVGLYLVGAGTLLDHFDTALRPSIWRKPMPKPGDLPLESDELTELRFPFIRNFAWGLKYGGYLLRFHIGATDSEDVLLSDCGLKDIRFVPQEGGSAGIGFNIKAYPKGETDYGKIATRLQQEIIITLTPPDQYADPDLFDGDHTDMPDDDSHDPFAHSDPAQDDTRIE